MEDTLGNEREVVACLLFRIRHHLCALPLEYVVETMRPLPIETIRGSPDVVQGLAVIRGVPVPVVDVGFFLDREETPSTRFITVRTGAHHVALAVQSIVGLHSLSIDTLREIPPLLGEAGDRAVAAIGTFDADFLLVLDTAHIVPESVWQALTAPGESP